MEVGALIVLIVGLLFFPAAHGQPSMQDLDKTNNTLLHYFHCLTAMCIYNTAVAFTEVSENIDIDEDGGMGMFCVAIVDDGNDGGGTTTAITVSLSTPIIAGTNPVGMCYVLE